MNHCNSYHCENKNSIIIIIIIIIITIYQISKTLDKDAEMAKRNLFVTFKTKLQSKINLAILKFKSNYEFKMRAFSRKHFKMNTNIIVS